MPVVAGKGIEPHRRRSIIDASCDHSAWNRRYLRNPGKEMHVRALQQAAALALQSTTAGEINSFRYPARDTFASAQHPDQQRRGCIGPVHVCSAAHLPLFVDRFVQAMI